MDFMPAINSMCGDGYETILESMVYAINEK